MSKYDTPSPVRNLHRRVRAHMLERRGVDNLASNSFTMACAIAMLAMTTVPLCDSPVRFALWGVMLIFMGKQYHMVMRGIRVREREWRLEEIDQARDAEYHAAAQEVWYEDALARARRDAEHDGPGLATDLAPNTTTPRSKRTL